MFFFKQKTAYEMRISDWSSDVCSSDLAADVAVEPAVDDQLIRRVIDAQEAARRAQAAIAVIDVLGPARQPDGRPPAMRSAERRVGKECVSPGRSRWWAHQ